MKLLIVFLIFAVGWTTFAAAHNIADENELIAEDELVAEHQDEFFGWLRKLFKSKSCIICEEMIVRTTKGTHNFHTEELERCVKEYGCKKVRSIPDLNMCVAFIKSKSPHSIAKALKRNKKPAETCKALKC